MGIAQRFEVDWNEAVAAPRRSAVHVTTETVFLFLFIAGIVWVPYWLGSNRLFPWGINAVIFPGLLACYELSLMIRGLPHPVPMRLIRASA